MEKMLMKWAPGAEAGMFYINWVNIVAADALALCATGALTAMELNMWDKQGICYM